MCPPLIGRRLVQSGMQREGFVANPHTRQLVRSGQIPAHFIAVYYAVAVVVAVSSQAGPCHAMVCVFQLGGVVGNFIVDIGIPLPVRMIRPASILTAIEIPDICSVETAVLLAVRSAVHRVLVEITNSFITKTRWPIRPAI